MILRNARSNDEIQKDHDFIIPFVSYFIVASELGVVDSIHHHFVTCQLIGNAKPLKVCDGARNRTGERGSGSSGSWREVGDGSCEHGVERSIKYGRSLQLQNCYVRQRTVVNELVHYTCEGLG